MQLFGVLFFALTIPSSAMLAERGRRRTLIWVTVGDRRLRLRDGAAVRAGTAGARADDGRLGLALMGLTYGPLGTVLSELFPTAVRYTGSSLTFNLAGIFGASLAPYIAPGWPPTTACSTSATTCRRRRCSRCSGWVHVAEHADTAL